MEVHASRNVSPWILLWNNCTWSYNMSLEGEGQNPYLLFTMLLCAFSLEAYLNQLLRHYSPGDWEEYERQTSPIDKLAKLCDALQFPIDNGKRPFQTFTQIFKFRNDIVHAKTIKVEKVFLYSIERFLQSDDLPPIPLTRWEKALTPQSSKRFYDDSKDIIITLHKEANLGDDPFDGTYSKTMFTGNI